MTKLDLPPAPTLVRPLSESEIQDRLYGNYLGRKRSAPPAPEPAEHLQPERPKEKEWTGSEILTGELQRLRSELISLRQEKDRLAAKLQQAGRPAPEAKKDSGSGRWISKVFVSLLLLGVAGYIAGGAALQASPSAGDLTPYTVQVAVYDGHLMADQARRMLEELGYDAFMVEVPRLNGSMRYRIYVGSFVTKEEAARESQRLAADTRFRDFKDAFVLVR